MSAPTPQNPDQQRRYQHFLNLKDLIVDANQRATDLGIAALKSVMLINGAAAAALLAFIGQVGSKGAIEGSKITHLLPPLKFLVGGVLVAALATGFGYMRMFFESVAYAAELKKPGTGKVWTNTGNGFLYGAIVLTIASYVLFGCGMWFAADAIRGILQ